MPSVQLGRWMFSGVNLTPLSPAGALQGLLTYLGVGIPCPSPCMDPSLSALQSPLYPGSCHLQASALTLSSVWNTCPGSLAFSSKKAIPRHHCLSCHPFCFLHNWCIICHDQICMFPCQVIMSPCEPPVCAPPCSPLWASWKRGYPQSCSSWGPQFLEQCLAHSRSSVNNYWIMDGWMNESLSELWDF